MPNIYYGDGRSLQLIMEAGPVLPQISSRTLLFSRYFDRAGLHAVPALTIMRVGKPLLDLGTANPSLCFV